MYATRRIFSGRCLAQAYVIRKPLLQKQNQPLEEMYEKLQTDTAINRSLLSDHELVQDKAATIDQDLAKKRNLDATSSMRVDTIKFQVHNPKIFLQHEGVASKMC